MSDNLTQTAPTYSLIDQVALVTGGGNGIGKAAALAYAAAGAKVAVADINAEAAAAVRDLVKEQGGQAISLTADLTQPEQVAKMVEAVVSEFGQLDIAFNNAGIDLEAAPLARITEDTFDQLVDVNVKGVWLCMKAEIEQMLKQGKGSIVNTASVGGLVGAPGQPIYGTTKHAVVGMTKSAACEYAYKGIRINAVCPGVIETAMTERAVARNPKRQDHIVGFHPIGRLGTAEEVANAVVFLSSPQASFIVGVALPVDGGFTAR